MNTGLILMFVALAVCLLIGVPVAFSIGISCMTLLYVNGGPSMDILLQRMVSGAKSFNMLAMPMFIFAGALMVYGSTPRLIKLANMLLRKFPRWSGVQRLWQPAASSVPFPVPVSPLLPPSARSSAHPCWRRVSQGPDGRLIAAGGTMACIIPPSIVMVVYAQSASVSVGDMFLGGVVPGLLTIIALIALNSFFAVRRQKKENKDPHEYTVNERMKIILDALLPLLMPVAILGGVFSGLCTATEAAVVAVVYALFLAVFVYRELTLKDFFKVSADAVVSTGVIMLIISVASPFGWLMSTQKVPQMFASWLMSITDSKFLILAFIFLLLMILGMFMETVCIIILTTPILLPIAVSVGLTPLHFGIALLMTLMVGSLTPPLSVNLFTSCRVLGMKVDEAFPDTLYVIGTVALMAILTFTIPRIGGIPARCSGRLIKNAAALPLHDKPPGLCFQKPGAFCVFSVAFRPKVYSNKKVVNSSLRFECTSNIRKLHIANMPF